MANKILMSDNIAGSYSHIKYILVKYFKNYFKTGQIIESTKFGES